MIDVWLVIRLYGIANVPRSSQVRVKIGRDLSTRRDGYPPHDGRGGGPPPPQGRGTDTPVSEPELRPAR
jgi:hypothetical protein